MLGGQGGLNGGGAMRDSIWVTGIHLAFVGSVYIFLEVINWFMGCSAFVRKEMFWRLCSLDEVWIF